MALPVNNKNNKSANKNQKQGQGSKFIMKPTAAKPGNTAGKKPTRTGGTRGS